MINVTPKSNPPDVAAVLSLMAFLADKDACAARMVELQDAVTVAETAQARAEAEQLKMAEAQVAAEQREAAAKAREDRLEVFNAKLHDIASKLDTRGAAVKIGEKANQVAAVSLDKKTAEMESLIENLKDRSQQLAIAENVLSERVAEHEEKVAKLSALISG